MKEQKTEGECCICHGDYENWGNNAQPIMDGRCCDRCNNTVIAARMNIAFRKKEVKEKKSN